MVDIIHKSPKYSEANPGGHAQDEDERGARGWSRRRLHRATSMTMARMHPFDHVRVCEAAKFRLKVACVLCPPVTASSRGHDIRMIVGFEGLSDFSPQRCACRVDELRKPCSRDPENTICTKETHPSFLLVRVLLFCSPVVVSSSTPSSAFVVSIFSDRC